MTDDDIHSIHIGRQWTVSFRAVPFSDSNVDEPEVRLRGRQDLPLVTRDLVSQHGADISTQTSIVLERVFSTPTGMSATQSVFLSIDFEGRWTGNLNGQDLDLSGSQNARIAVDSFLLNDGRKNRLSMIAKVDALPSAESSRPAPSPSLLDAHLLISQSRS